MEEQSATFMVASLPRPVRVRELTVWHVSEESGPPLRKLESLSQLRSQRREGRKEGCPSGLLTEAEGGGGKCPVALVGTGDPATALL